MELENIKKILGLPFYENKYGLIYNMDCIEAMKILPPNVIDITFTSPPYNIGKTYENVMNVESYVEWCYIWLKEIHRITKHDGSLWLNIGYLFLPHTGKAVPISYLLWNKTSFYLQQEIVWNYGAGVACKNMFSPRNEKILWFVKDENNYIFNLDAIRDKNVKYPNQKKNGKLRCNTLGKNPSDVWQIAKVTSGKGRMSSERTSHPAQTPVDLLDRVILGGSHEQNIVLDPFMGSGSTAISAIKNNRRFICFEIDRNYCKLAEKRIMSFIQEREEPHEQLYLFRE